MQKQKLVLHQMRVEYDVWLQRKNPAAEFIFFMADLVWHLKENNAPIIVNIKKNPITIFMEMDWKTRRCFQVLQCLPVGPV